MTPDTTIRPFAAPQGVPDAPARPCATLGCNREAQRDARHCSRCLTDLWMLRTPEWLRRGREGLNRPKDLTGAA